MAESGGSPPVAEEEEHHGGQEERGLSETQRQMLDRCLHALKQAKNDSHVLAALLLVSDEATLWT